MSKCDCCKEENSELITFKGRRICPACYMGYVSKVKVCENNAIYEAQIDKLKKQLAEKDKEIALLKHLGNHETAIEMFKENAKHFIIDVLEEVKEFFVLEDAEGIDITRDIFEVAEYVNAKINALKGGENGT